MTAAAVATIGIAGPALAGCFDLLGCTDRDLFSKHFSYLASRSQGPNCDFLWQMRNQIFAEHGYCFRTARGISEIGNEGCRYNDLASVPLNAIERANVATIAQAERLKSCPR
jgi:hypothetical protein